MHKDCEKILFTEEQLKKRISEVALEVNGKFAGKSPIVVSILKGSVIFFADFVRHLDASAELDFMSVSSYGSGTVSSGKLNIRKDLDRNIEGRDIIIVEDIIDSGITLTSLKALLKGRGAKSVTVVTLLNKKARRVVDIEPDYNCFDIDDEFVIGFGLDYDDKYRTLPYIAVLKRSVYE